MSIPDTTTPVETPRAGVYIANVNPGSVGLHFTKSLVDLVVADHLNRWGCWRGNLWASSGANISKARNELVNRFFDQPDGEWLLFLDSDMVFPPETIIRLLAAAERAGTKVIGGLCVMLGDLGPIPTLYQYDIVTGSNGITRVQFDYPDNALLQVAATGAACLMIHRSVLQAMQDAAGGSEYAWFQECTMTRGDTTHWVSEDIAFCLRANDLGHPVFVDCTLEVGHAKHGRIWYPRDIRDEANAPKRRIVAVIPVKDKLGLTRDLVHQLRSQGGCDEIIVCDNGSGRETRNWLASQDDITVLDCPDVGIHEMWNQAVERAIAAHTARVRIAFLNNDLNLGPEFLKRLSRALDDNRDLTAVCGNYDGRSAEAPVVKTDDICAGRYDGTGGFAGFAYMVRGEWFSSGYRFPTEMQWWFGDNDLVATIAYSSRPDEPKGCGIVVSAAVEHLDGGGKTAGDPAWSDPRWDDMKRRDAEAFQARWQRIRDADEASRRLASGDLTPFYRHLCDTPSDINEHLPTLCDLAVKLDARKVIELGVRQGVSSTAWLVALAETGGHLWAVDVNPAPPFVADHPRCTFTLGDDLDPHVLAQLPDDADVVFVDTDHRYTLTANELATYSKRVRPGGCMVLHDVAVETFEHHEPGSEPPFPVRRAVEEFARDYDLRVDWAENNNGLAVVWL